MAGVHQFKIVVEPAPEPADIERLFESPDEPTAEICPRQNLGIVWCTTSAATLATAVVDAVTALEQLGLRAVRVEPQPWLTLDDIAGRLARSREAVRQWAGAAHGPGDVRGPGAFPPPLAPGGPTALWAWPQVSRWLRDELGYHLPDDRAVVTAACLALRLRALTPEVPGMRALRRLLAP